MVMGIFLNIHIKLNTLTCLYDVYGDEMNEHDHL